MSGANEIITERLKIIPFSEKFLTAKYVGWLNDKETMKFSDQRFYTHSLKSCREYFLSFTNSRNSFWAITYENGHVGNMTVYKDVLHNVADISIMVGERSLWGKGIGLEAWNGMCNFLFQTDSVRKITAGTLEVNFGMLSIMKKSNMQPDGIRIKHCLIDGRAVDMIHMALFNPQL